MWLSLTILLFLKSASLCLAIQILFLWIVRYKLNILIFFVNWVYIMQFWGDKSGLSHNLFCGGNGHTHVHLIKDYWKWLIMTRVVKWLLVFHQMGCRTQDEGLGSVHQLRAEGGAHQWNAFNMQEAAVTCPSGTAWEQVLSRALLLHEYAL